MLILAVSDFHGAVDWLPDAIDKHHPALLLSPGDWGDPGEVTESSLSPVLERVTVLTVSGNHDDEALLRQLRNTDGTPVLLDQGEAREVSGVTIGGISGIWAKTKLGSKLTPQWESARRRQPDLTFEQWAEGRKLPPYVTDSEVSELAEALAARGVDILISHGCPIGWADRTPTGGRGGQRCFRLASEAISPKIHLCGHLHEFQRQDLPGGRCVLNCGHGAAGHGWLIDWRDEGYQAWPLLQTAPLH